MKPIILSKFGGIAPIFEGHMPNTATTCRNCDVSSGRPRPLNDNLLMQAVANASSYNSIVEYQGTWYYGINAFYLDWVIGGLDVLFWLESGVAMKKVNGITATLGQQIPEAPAASIFPQTSTIHLGLLSTYKWRATNITNVYRCLLRSTSGNPGLSLPLSITINGTLATRGSMTTGLSPGQWDYGNFNKLGYKTIWVYITGGVTTATTIIDNAGPEQIDLGIVSTYTWKASKLNSAYQYCVLRATKGNPGLSLPPSVYINGVEAVQGDCTVKAGGLTNLQWDYGDTTADNLGYNTIYICITNGLTSTDAIHADTNPGDINGTVYYSIVSERTIGGILGPETCSSPANFGNKTQWKMSGDFTASGSLAEFIYTTGSGTITQPAAQQASPAVANATYQLQYYIQGVAVPNIVGAAMSLSGVSGGDVDLPISPGWSIIQFESAETPGDLVISVTGATSGAFTIQSMSLMHVIEEGMVDDSGPSAATDPLTVTNGIIQIDAPTFADPNVTSWYIYRLSTLSAAWQLVSQVPASVTVYLDSAADADLGTAMTTQYTGASSGETITYAPPPTFTGMAAATYSGMIFAWNGSTLYWCEPGKPDVWPGVYSIEFMHPILNVICGILGAIVLCEDGPYPIMGTDSETMYAAIPLGTEGCLSPIACSTAKGVIYVADDGLMIVTWSGTSSITDSAFGRDWWRKNISGYLTMVENDKRLILSYAGGTLILNASMLPQLSWGTLDDIFYASWKNPADGCLYVLDGQGIKQFMGASDLLNLDWMSAKLYGPHPMEKTFDTAVVRGTGTITLNIGIGTEGTPEGTTVATKVINMDSTLDRDKKLKFPEQTTGKYCTVELVGTGSVDDVVIGLLEA